MLAKNYKQLCSADIIIYQCSVLCIMYVILQYHFATMLM